MNTYKITLFLLLLSATTFSQNFWMQTNGPTGGNCYNIAFAPNNDIYSVGGYDHIYRSTNEGITWSKTNFINNGAYRYRCYSLVISQNGNIIAGGGDNIYPGHHDPKEGIFKSTDNGITWLKIIDAGYSKIVDFTALPNGYLFAARDADVEHQSPGGMYRSINNGETWEINIIPPFMIAQEGIKCIAADNSGKVYAGTTTPGYGYFYSDNFGATWTNRRDFYFTDIAVNQINGKVFAIKPDDGVYRSIDYGLNWVKVSGSNLNSAISIRENSNGVFFVQTNTGIFYTVNDGDTWLAVTTPSGLDIETIASKSNGNLYIGTNGEFIYKTSNNGANWTNLSDGTINSDIAAIAVNTQGTIFAAKQGGKIYYSTNNGENWNLIPTSIDSISSLAIDTLNYLFAVRKSAILRSMDNGSTWTSVTSNLPSGMPVKFVQAGMDGNVYAAYNTNVGIFRTINHGNSWLNTGLNFPINVLAVSKQGIIYAHVNNSGLFRTTNYGLNWYLLPQQLDQVKSISLNTSGNVFICSSNMGLIRSYDFGMNWQPINNGMNVFPHQVVANTQNYLFAVSTAPNEQSYFYRSLNNGDQWQSMNSGWGFNQYSSYLIAGPSGHLYTKAYKNFFNQSSIGIWRTFTSTNTYTISGYVRYLDSNNNVTSGYVKAVTFYNGSMITLDSARIQPNGYYILIHVPPGVPTDLMAVQDDEEEFSFVPTYYSSTIYSRNSTKIYVNSNMTDMNIHVYRITNNSQSSGKIGGGIYISGLDNMGGLNGAVIYAKMNDEFKGYSISKNGGQYMIDSLPQGSYEIICDLLGYGDQNRMISLGTVNIDTVDFYFSHWVIGIQNKNKEIPEKYFLGQNYPNPFNPVTKIKFAIPKAGTGGDRVKLVIYDLLGKEVATLVNEQLSPGTYEVEWNASGYSSGIYFYRLTTSNNKFSDTKKLVLIK
ncbi:MAG: T9SS C-terminal target domain-containing protein [Ignavibacteriae bacterium]|nr:MAG: T9SS C-terminal target domain-containing protein [Ignavibacteriota bacterium]